MTALDAQTLTILGLVATWILVVGTLALMYWQTRQNQVLNSANAVLTLRERFDSSRMRSARRHLSQMLLAGSHEDIVSMEVLTFFELVGTMTRRKLLDEELIWEAFGTWITTYYSGVRRPRDLVQAIRTALKDPLVFRNFEWLYDQVEALDRKALGEKGAAEVEDDLEVRAFLSREATLLESWGADDAAEGLDRVLVSPSHLAADAARAGTTAGPNPPTR